MEINLQRTKTKNRDLTQFLRPEPESWAQFQTSFDFKSILFGKCHSWKVIRPPQESHIEWTSLHLRCLKTWARCRFPGKAGLISELFLTLVDKEGRRWSRSLFDFRFHDKTDLQMYKTRCFYIGPEDGESGILIHLWQVSGSYRLSCALGALLGSAVKAHPSSQNNN